MAKNTLYVLVGPSGAGKTTWREAMGLPCVCPDDIREELSGDASDQSRNASIFNDIVPARLADFIRVGDCILDSTSLSRSDRARWIRLAEDNGAEAVAVFFDVNWETCKERNRRRKAEGGRFVPEWVIDKQFAKLQTPHVSEGFHAVLRPFMKNYEKKACNPL